ncbi:hypothetical protein BGZ97_002183, partial [Linnemannia gamsii]
MTKRKLSSPSGPCPQPVSHQGHPNAGRDGDDDDQSVSSQSIRKGDRSVNMFRPSSQKPKATNSTSTSPRSTITGTSASTKVATHHLSGVGTPGSVDIGHVVSTTAEKTTPSAPLATPRLDVFPRNVRAPSVCITLPKFGARIETTPQLALCIGLLSKA